MSESPGSDRLPRRSLLAYGAGIIAYQFPNGAFASLAMPLFNIVLGIPAISVGAILTGGRLWDAITNPIMGAISDGSRTRWGRRRPFLVAGALATGITYPLLWLEPRHWGATAIVVYLSAATLVMYTAFAVYSVPYIALGFELTPDVNERTRVQIWRSYLNVIPAFAIGWLYWLCQRPFLGGAMAGARWIGLACGLVILLTGAIPGIFLRERYYRLSSSAPKEPFSTAFREVAQNRPFMLILALIVTLIIGTQSTDALGIYVLSYYLFPGDPSGAGKLLGIGATASMVMGLAALPALQALDLRIGKVRTLRLCICVSMVADLMKWFCISPRHLWTWPVVIALKQLGDIGFWVFVASMKADTCDWDELNSGRRREGTYGAMASLVQKMATSLVYLLAGVLVTVVGLNAAAGGRQSPETIIGLRAGFSLLPILSLGICLILLGRYPLTVERMAAVRSELEARRSRV